MHSSLLNKFFVIIFFVINTLRAGVRETTASSFLALVFFGFILVLSISEGLPLENSCRNGSESHASKAGICLRVRGCCLLLLTVRG